MPHNHLESKANLAKLASYAAKLAQLGEDAHLEDWVEKKITEAAENIATVYHFVEYEAKFNDYSKMLESKNLTSVQRNTLTVLLAEAKSKVKELKKVDAEKKSKKEEKIDESHMRETPCAECGGTGVVMKPLDPGVQSKLQKYKRETEAFAAAHRRMDKNHNGIPDDEEKTEEGFEAGAKPGDTFKTGKGTATKTKTGLVHNREKYDYDPGSDNKEDKKLKSSSHRSRLSKAVKDMEFDEGFEAGAKPGDTFKTTKGTATKTKTGLVHSREKYDYDPGSDDKDDKKAKAKAKKTVNEGSEHLANLAHHHATEYAKAVREGRIEEALHHKQKCEECGGKISHNPAGGVFHTHTGINNGQMYECSAVAPTPAPASGVMEGKPSAGLSKEKKSATVKAAKAGKDIGKPGKNFEKVAKKAAAKYGSKEKGEKVAAAAMWKNIKETTAYIEEKKAIEKKADKDYDGDGKIESNKDEVWGSRAKAAAKAGHPFGKKETVKESTDFTRMQEQLARLNRSETQTLKESSEADKIRALTQKLLG